eukprot:scaffold88780_cov17-Tisochrysis_lutea.AAC.3
MAGRLYSVSIREVSVIAHLSISPTPRNLSKMTVCFALGKNMKVTYMQDRGPWTHFIGNRGAFACYPGSSIRTGWQQQYRA